MEIEKLHHKSLSEEVFELLREKIIRWKFRPGQRLKDRELAEGLGVSRSLVRHAFTLLEKDGLVKVSRTGVYVSRFTKREIQEIYEVRRLLESFALESAYDNITDEELDEIEGKINETKRDLEMGQLEASYALDVAIHQLIVNKCNNSQIKKMYSNYRSILGIIILSDYNKPDNVVESFEEHCRIFEAIKQRDLNKAREALLSHLSGSMNRVIEMFGNMASSNTSGP
ncbi:MAG: GntR family transcriptional regulator [Deltaproteobacteria bacterium]|nr:GntR family transcriptional regulator [Deltaproteobacteria bacterium]